MYFLVHLRLFSVLFQVEACTSRWKRSVELAPPGSRVARFIGNEMQGAAGVALEAGVPVMLGDADAGPFLKRVTALAKQTARVEWVHDQLRALPLHAAADRDDVVGALRSLGDVRRREAELSTPSALVGEFCGLPCAGTLGPRRRPTRSRWLGT